MVCGKQSAQHKKHAVSKVSAIFIHWIQPFYPPTSTAHWHDIWRFQCKKLLSIHPVRQNAFYAPSAFISCKPKMPQKTFRSTVRISNTFSYNPRLFLTGGLFCRFHCRIPFCACQAHLHLTQQQAMNNNQTMSLLWKNLIDVWSSILKYDKLIKNQIIFTCGKRIWKGDKRWTF